ncbi:MAG: TonB-dependent receptor plug domain-containing protein, partial [Gemmatimonadota bacterium]
MRQIRRGPIGADGRTRRLSAERFALRVLVLLATLAATVMPGRPAQAQEPDRPAPSDSVRADSLAAAPAEADSARRTAEDSLVGPLSQPLEGTLQDSTVDEGYALLPALPDLPPGASATVEVDLDRDRILQSNALNLLELLEEEPGFTPLRATWFGGPLQVTAGILGPAFLTVVVNGREVTTMDGGQPDLTRFPIAYLQRVRLLRVSAGWVVEITTLARDSRDAYSRIEGGTGDPGLSRLRLVFDNGLGRNFRVAASADLVDAEGAHPSSDFDFFGLFEWVPGRGASGIAFSYESESIDRDVYSPVTMRRTELFLRGQLQLSPSLRVDAFGGQTGWKQEAEGATPDAEPDDRTVVSGGLVLTGDWDRVWARAAAATWASDYHPEFQFDADVGGTIFGPLQADAGGRFAAWDGFDATELRGGLSVRLPMHLTLRALGTTGTRGVSYPTAERVDSLNFDQLTGRIDLTLPSVSLYGLVERQNLDRQLPFRSVFDLYQSASPGPIAATAFEVGGDVPVLPLSWLVEDAAPIRLSGFWRYQSVDPLLDAMYVPNYLIRGVLGFQDEFYDGNLGIDMGLGLKYRGSMSAPSVDAATQENSALVAIPDYLYLDWN